MDQEKITVKLPFSEELLDELFGEFCWDRTRAGDPHPETTGNCTGHPKPRGFDNETGGEYQNAAYYCRHCYHGGNPARMTWEREKQIQRSGYQGVITLECCTRSSKPLRALIACRRVTGREGYPILGLDADELREVGLLE